MNRVNPTAAGVAENFREMTFPVFVDESNVCGSISFFLVAADSLDIFCTRPRVRILSGVVVMALRNLSLYVLFFGFRVLFCGNVCARCQRNVFTYFSGGNSVIYKVVKRGF